MHHLGNAYASLLTGSRAATRRAARWRSRAGEKGGGRLIVVGGCRAGVKARGNAKGKKGIVDGSAGCSYPRAQSRRAENE